MTVHVKHAPGQPCTPQCWRWGSEMKREPVLVHDPSTATLTITPAGMRALRRSKRERAQLVHVAVFCVAFGLGTLLGLVLQWAFP